MLDIIVAAVAGFVSFISPCVLPLVPAYIGYMGGRVTNTVSAQVSVGADGSATATRTPLSMRLSTFVHGLAFVAGFTFIFVTLGILGTAFVRQIGSTATVEGIIGRIGGILVIFFGLHFMGVLPKVFTWLRERQRLLSSPLTTLVVGVVGSMLLVWGFSGTLAVWNTSALTFVGWATTLGLALAAIYVLALVIGGALTSPGTFWNKTLNTLDYALYADTRRQLTAEGNQGLSGSALMGVVFAAGWTPCIGPTLGLAFTLAANGGDIGQAATLMTAYSLGLGIPFLITALAMDSAQGALRGLKRHMGTIKTVSGAFLVFIGVLIASGRLQEISRQFSVEFGDFSYRIEECTVGLFDGDINAGQYGTCIGSEGGVAALSGATAGAAGIETTSDSSTSATDTSVASAEAVEVGLAVGNRAPEFTTTTIDGEPVALSDFEGDVVLLNFWFTTCEPCRVEMPEFQRAFDAHADDGFTVVAVNREEGPETIRTFAEDYDLDFPLLLDEEGDIQFQYGVTGYPSTFILDRDGVIVWRNFGPISVETIQERIDEVLS